MCMSQLNAKMEPVGSYYYNPTYSRTLYLYCSSQFVDCTSHCMAVSKEGE